MQGRWISEEFQRNYLLNNPTHVKDLVDNMVIHPQIKKEFAYLFNTLRVGLI